MTLTDNSSYPIRDAFQKFLPEYLDSHSLTPQQWKTANCIANCKTGGLGYNVSYCEECGHVEIHASSCNNRHCPCCQAPIEQKWIMERNSELIEGIAYYHAIFTVPYELNSLIYENQELLYGLMFRCASFFMTGTSVLVLSAMVRRYIFPVGYHWMRFLPAVP